MKLVFALGLISLFALQARAEDSLSCEYLHDAAGVRAPGMSLPNVTIDEAGAEVDYLIDAGPGAVARAAYDLRPVARTRTSAKYADDSGRVILEANTGHQAVLRVRELISNCTW